MGFIESASAADAPIGRAALNDLVVQADAGTRVVVGTGLSAALIVDAVRVAVNAPIGADTLTVGGTARVSGDAALDAKLDVAGAATMHATTRMVGTVVADDEVALHKSATIDRAVAFVDTAAVAPTARSLSTHATYGMRVGNARVVGAGDVLGSVVVADRVYERSETTPPFLIRVSAVDAVLGALTMTKTVDPTWSPPSDSTFMLEPAVPDGTYAVVAVGSVSGQTCEQFLYKSQNLLVVQANTQYTFTLLVSTTTADVFTETLKADPNAPVTYPVPGYVISSIEPALSFGGAQIFPVSDSGDKYYYDVDSEQAFRLVGTNTLVAVGDAIRPLEMRSEVLSSSATRADPANTDGTIALTLATVAPLSARLVAPSAVLPGASTFEEYDGKAVRLHVGGRTFPLQRDVVTARATPGAATFSRFVVALADAADATAPELQGTTGYVLVTDVASAPGRGLSEATATFNCTIEVAVMEEFTDLFLNFNGPPPTAAVASAFFSASITTVGIGGVTYDAVGKDVVVPDVRYRVRLLTSDLDTGALDVGNAVVTLKYQDADPAAPIVFLFRCHAVDSITVPARVSAVDVPATVDFGALSARLDLSGLFDPLAFNAVPINAYIKSMQVRASVLNIRTTTISAASPPGSLVVDFAYAAGERNVLVNGLNTFNATLAGAPVFLRGLTTNGLYTACVFEAVIEDDPYPVPDGSSHVFVYTETGYTLMRITSRYRNNDGLLVHDLLPVRAAPPDWAAVTAAAGDRTVLYVIPFGVASLYDVGQGGPYSILSKPAVARPAWAVESAVPEPERYPRLVIVAEAPLRTPSAGAPATMTAGPAFAAAGLRALPAAKDPRFPRAAFYVHDAEPPDAHTYTFFADVAAPASGGTVATSYRLSGAWCAPGGSLEFYFPGATAPTAVSRADGETRGVVDPVAGTYTSADRFGGIFYARGALGFGGVQAVARDVWLTAVVVSPGRTVAAPAGALELYIDGTTYDATSGSVTVPATVAVGPAIALVRGDLYDATAAVLSLPATTANVVAYVESVTVPAVHLAGGAGPRYLSLTVTGSDGFARHLAIPASGVVTYQIAGAPLAPSPTRSARMHLDGVAKAAGLGVLLPGGVLSSALTQYFRYAGDSAARYVLTPGVAYAAPGARSVLTLADNTARRLTSCVATVTTPGVATLAAGTGAEMAEGVDAFMLEGGLLTGASLTGDVLTYTPTAETAALLAAGPSPGSAMFTLVGKARMRVRATRMTSVAALPFQAGATTSLSAAAAAPLVSAAAILPIAPPPPIVSGVADIPLYDQVDALPWAPSLTATVAGDRDAAGTATLLLKLTGRGRSWLETTVTVVGGTATLAAAAPDPAAGCVVVSAVNGGIFGATLAAGVRTFPCSGGAQVAAPALLIHPGDVVDVQTHDSASGSLSVRTSPTTAARLRAPGAALFVEEFNGETDVLVVSASAETSDTTLLGAGTAMKTVALTTTTGDAGARNLGGTRTTPLIVACPDSASSTLTKIVDLEQLDTLRVGSALENGGALTVGGDVEVDGAVHVRNARGDAITLATDAHGLATVRRRTQDATESVAIAPDGAVVLRRGLQPRAVQVLSDQRFGNLQVLDGAFTDSALQYLRRATFARDANGWEVRLLPHAPLPDGHTGRYAVGAASGGTVVCGRPTVATCSGWTVAFDWTAFGLKPVIDDWVVVTLADGVRRRLRVRSTAIFSATYTLTVNHDFGATSVAAVLELVELASAWTYDSVQLGATTAAAVYELSRAVRVVDSTKTRFHDLEVQGSGVRPVGAGTNVITLYISDPATVSAAQTSALATVLDADKRLQVSRDLVKDWTNFEVGTDLDQKTTVLHGALTVGTTRSSGSTAGYHAATRLFGSLTLGESTTTGQEATVLNGALTVGESVGTGAIAGKHGNTRLYGTLTVGEDTVSAQEASRLYGALTVGATEVGGVTAGHHAATRLYGPLTLGEATTTGQEATVLNGPLRVGESVGAGSIAGKHANSVLYGSLTVGEASSSAQEPTTLNGALTVGTQAFTAATQMHGNLTVGVSGEATKKSTTLNGPLTVASSQATNLGGTLTVQNSSSTSLTGPLTVSSSQATNLGGTLTVQNSSSTSLTGPLTVSSLQATNLGGTLTVSQGATMSSTLTVSGASTLTGAVSVQGTDVVTRISTAKTEAQTFATNADNDLKTGVIATAQSTANTAVTNAATAQTTANTAVTNAATAQTTANAKFTLPSNVTISDGLVAATKLQVSSGKFFTNDTFGILADCGGYAVVFGNDGGFRGSKVICTSAASELGAGSKMDGREIVAKNTNGSIGFGATGNGYSITAANYEVGLGRLQAYPGFVRIWFSNTSAEFDFKDDGQLLVGGVNIAGGGTAATTFTGTSVSITGDFPNRINISAWRIYTYVVSGVRHLALDNGAINGGFINGSNTISQLNFTGVHRCFVTNVEHAIDDFVGLLVVAKNDDYVLMSGGFKRGYDAITISESLPIVSISTEKSDSRVFGVIADREGEERNEGYGVFFTKFEKPVGDTRYHINSLGEGGIWVCDENGDVLSGSYVTSSSVPGYGCVQDSDCMMSYTAAKMTMSCDFTNPSRQKLTLKAIQRTGTREKKVNYMEEITSVEHINGRYVSVKRFDEKEEVLTQEFPLYNESGEVIGTHTANVMEEYTYEENEVDESGNAIWVPLIDATGKLVMEPKYRMRWLTSDGMIITEDDYGVRKANGETVYRAAFLGCTYHCG